MEALIIPVLAILSLALVITVIFLLWRLVRDRSGAVSTRDSLVGQQVTEMKAELNKVSELVRDLEKDRENKFGQLTSQLKTVGEQTASLATTTGQLREALANTRIRGQWGERMAEDVLRLIGFVEGVNYEKQATQASIDGSGEGGGSRPDFTIYLPPTVV